ncbi:hypothetical protein [Gorillibacterium timonense]|nr:hypothetical protein [Gorillibacterium timonense]
MKETKLHVEMKAGVELEIDEISTEFDLSELHRSTLSRFNYNGSSRC